MNFYKRDTLNDKFEEFENRFQLKLDEQNIAHKTHIQKLDDKISKLETKNSITYELIDKLYECRFNEISCHITHQVSETNIKIDNTFKTLHEELQNIMLLTKEQIKIITDKVEICMNEIKQINILNNNQKEMSIEIKNINNKFDKDIHKLTTQQEVTNEKVILLNHYVSSIETDVSAITENITALEERQWLSDIYDLKIMAERIVKLEDKQLSYCNDLKKITKQINILTTKQSLTDDVLLNIQNEIILINTDSRIENNNKYNVINELSEKIKILTDNVSNIQNINNKFDREIHTLTTQQQFTTENLNDLQNTYTWSIDKLEICMNAIKLINVFEEPMFGRDLNKLPFYNSTNRYLGTSIILLDSEPHEFSYINQFYNLKVLVINNWNLFNYGVFCPNNRSSKADNFKMMCDRYGEMNNKTLETFIIHSSYELNINSTLKGNQMSRFRQSGIIHVTTCREPLLLEYLCMQLKNFPSLKIVKLYYLDLPLNIEDIIINNLENMTHTIKELHIISNTIQQSSKLKMYCDNKKIILKGLILLKEKSAEAFQRDVITPLNQKLMNEDDGGYMRRNKIIDRT